MSGYPEIRQRFTVSWDFPVVFTREVFAAGNDTLADVLLGAGDGPHRVLVLLEETVARVRPSLPEEIRRHGEARAGLLRFAAPPVVLPGGEACKQDDALVRRVHGLVERHGLCRQSFILAVGGGAFLDAAGFAAATAHRGVRLVRLPTTVLAQNDAGVGVKNAINACGRKNFAGTFAPPFAVIDDFAFLDTLPERELRAGLAEAVKVALLKDRAFFDWLEAERGRLARFEPAAMERMIVRCAGLHCRHIATAGDPFEAGSSRPLDFGHWVAHRLEEATAGELRHGEAVAIGIAADVLYGRSQGHTSDLDAHRILRLLEALGFRLYHPALGWLDIPQALDGFREHLGGRLTIPLLDGIGGHREVHEVDATRYRRGIAELAARTPEVTHEHGDGAGSARQVLP